MAVSIRDVAKRAGVTSSTVSRAFNHYTDILPKTKERIISAAKELGYVPNASARSLSAKRPPNICLIASNMMAGDDRDAMLYLVMKGIVSYAADHHLELTLYSLDSAEQKKTSFTDFCRLHSISGTIICGVKTNDPYFRELIHSGIPVVGIDLPITGDIAGWVSIDNCSAAAAAIEALFKRKLSRILVVAGKQNTTVNTERLEGVRNAYLAAGRQLDEENDLIFADFREETAHQMMGTWLEDHPLPDAVFCFSDLMALGVMRALKEARFQIPEDVSVMGFDGMPFGTLTDPPLSTVRQDMKGMGAEAAKFLHGLMAGSSTPGHHILPYTLVMRESVRAE